MFTLPDNVKVLNLPEQVEKNREDIASISSRVTSVSVHASDIGQQVKLHDADIEKLKTAVTDIDSGAINTHYLSVHGPADVSGKLTTGNDLEVDGKIILNSADDVVDGNGNKLIASVQLDEFKKTICSDLMKARMKGNIACVRYVPNDKGFAIQEMPTLSAVSLGLTTDFSECYEGANVAHIEDSSSADPICLPKFYNKDAKTDSLVSRMTWVDFVATVAGILYFQDGAKGHRAFDLCPNLKEVHSVSGYVKWYGDCEAMFEYDYNLTVIDGIDFSEARLGSYTFYQCSSLKRINAIHLHNSFNISSSTAFEQSDLVEIISNLDPVSTAQTLTMGATNLAKLTQDQILVATGKGWTLA